MLVGAANWKNSRTVFAHSRAKAEMHGGRIAEAI